MQEIYNSKTIPAITDSFTMKQGDGKYYPPKGLIKAIELALLLNKPLLIAGEPGTGKTDAAHHIAKHFGLGKLLIYNTQTTSEAKDLLYNYNSLAHFQYSRNSNNILTAKELVAKKFVSYAPLGEAIRDASKQKKRIVLIDEIDKAPRDLPNDMLDIIENMRFTITELKINKAEDEEDISEIKGDPDYKPIVIITTNSEKSLPEPFLRRCIFFYINFDKVDLLTILKNKLTFDYTDNQWMTIIHYFKLIREDLHGKKPATAELIMWAWTLHKYGISPEMLNGVSALNNKAELLKTSYSILIKDNEDWQRIIELDDDYFIQKIKS